MKTKREEKTKEQLVKESIQMEETKRMRQRVKDEFYPMLLDNSKSIDDAKVFCQTLSVGLRQAFNNQLTKQTVEEMNLFSMLDKDGENVERFTKALEMFSQEKLHNALNMIEGMQNAIDGFLREEITKRPLSSLKSDFL